MSKKYTLCKFTTGNVNDNVQVELNLHLFSRDYEVLYKTVLHAVAFML